MDQIIFELEKYSDVGDEFAANKDTLVKLIDEYIDLVKSRLKKNTSALKSLKKLLANGKLKMREIQQKMNELQAERTSQMEEETEIEEEVEEETKIEQQYETEIEEQREIDIPVAKYGNDLAFSETPYIKCSFKFTLNLKDYNQCLKCFAAHLRQYRNDRYSSKVVFDQLKENSDIISDVRFDNIENMKHIREHWSKLVLPSLIVSEKQALWLLDGDERSDFKDSLLDIYSSVVIAENDYIQHISLHQSITKLVNETVSHTHTLISEILVAYQQHNEQIDLIELEHCITDLNKVERTMLFVKLSQIKSTLDSKQNGHVVYERSLGNLLTNLQSKLQNNIFLEQLISSLNDRCDHWFHYNNDKLSEDIDRLIQLIENVRIFHFEKCAVRKDVNGNLEILTIYEKSLRNFNRAPSLEALAVVRTQFLHYCDVDDNTFIKDNIESFLLTYRENVIFQASLIIDSVIEQSNSIVNRDMLQYKNDIETLNQLCTLEYKKSDQQSEAIVILGKLKSLVEACGEAVKIIMESSESKKKANQTIRMFSNVTKKVILYCDCSDKRVLCGFKLIESFLGICKDNEFDTKKMENIFQSIEEAEFLILDKKINEDKEMSRMEEVGSLENELNEDSLKFIEKCTQDITKLYENVEIFSLEEVESFILKKLCNHDKTELNDLIEVAKYKAFLQMLDRSHLETIARDLSVDEQLLSNALRTTKVDTILSSKLSNNVLKDILSSLNEKGLLKKDSFVNYDTIEYLLLIGGDEVDDGCVAEFIDEMMSRYPELDQKSEAKSDFYDLLDVYIQNNMPPEAKFANESIISSTQAQISRLLESTKLNRLLSVLTYNEGLDDEEKQKIKDIFDDMDFTKMFNKKDKSKVNQRAWHRFWTVLKEKGGLDKVVGELIGSGIDKKSLNVNYRTYEREVLRSYVKIQGIESIEKRLAEVNISTEVDNIILSLLISIYD